MIANKNQRPPTVREQQRIDVIMALSCPVCALSGDMRPRIMECHHIVRGGKRLGHWWTLQMCQGHHRGIWTDQIIRVAISDGRHAFREAHGYDDLELWQAQQFIIGMDDALPPTKILPRREGLPVELLPEADVPVSLHNE